MDDKFTDLEEYHFGTLARASVLVLYVPVIVALFGVAVWNTLHLPLVEAIPCALYEAFVVVVLATSVLGIGWGDRYGENS
jgi:hypothetical protein